MENKSKTNEKLAHEICRYLTKHMESRITIQMLSAAKELKTTDKSVLEIAGSYGYDNGSKFAKAFRDCVGMSPLAYRKNG